MKIHPLITTSDALAALIQRMSAHDFVAVDTEFMRENTYWPELCLLQIATPDEAAAIDEFNDRLQADGHWVFAGGLGAPDSATVIDNRRGEAVCTDGPFVESKEHMAGFWILEAPDRDVALALATEGSKHCNRKVELRPLLGG